MYKYNLLYTCWWLLLGTGRSKNLTNRVLWTISITHGLSTNVASMKVIMTAECIRLAMELWLATRKHLWTSESRIWVSTSGVGILRKPQVKISGLSVFPVSKKSFFGWRFLVKTLQKEVSTQGNAFFFTSDPSLPGLKKTSVSFTTKIHENSRPSRSNAFRGFQTDPGYENWEGWPYLEMGFAFLLIMEILMRIHLHLGEKLRRAFGEKAGLRDDDDVWWSYQGLVGVGFSIHVPSICICMQFDITHLEDVHTFAVYSVFSPCHCLSIFASGGSPSRKTLYFIRFFMETNRVWVKINAFTLHKSWYLPSL